MRRLRKIFLLAVTTPVITSRTTVSGSEIFHGTSYDSTVIASHTQPSVLLVNGYSERVTITSRTTILTDETGTSTTDVIHTTDYDNHLLSSTLVYDPSYVFAGDAGPNDTDDGDLL